MSKNGGLTECNGLGRRLTLKSFLEQNIKKSDQYYSKKKRRQ